MNGAFPRDGWLLLFPPLFWAINSVVGRALAGHFPPIALSFSRWSLAFLILLPFALGVMRGQGSVLRRHWPALLALSLLGVGLYNSLLYTALITSQPVNVLLIGATAPSFVLLAEAALARRLPDWRAVLATLLSIGGVLAVGTGGRLANLAHLQFAQGDLVMIVATLVWAAYTLVLKRARPPMPMAPLLLVQIGVGAVLLLPAFLVEWLVFQPVMRLDGQVAASLVYVAIFPSILAYLCWDRGVAAAGAQVAVVLANLTPILAALLAWLFLGEAIGPQHLIAAAMIFTAIRLATAAPKEALAS
ncbi:MAG TPA: DMT family transporter [Geminicoccus sp.]|uniref:DMT family transporter n=1 Tax=Geminicoccus sp. TaxID=2024832 RepID=UPI002B9FAF5A|nr:DMT family transporter [Geminicoccus sp.]HWL68887.1 DMT family transporter [Geminicoccus sp.]